MTYEKKLKAKFWMLILVVFVLGSATGASIDALYRIRQARTQALRMAASSPMQERMRQELDLSDQQTDQLHVILLGARKEMGQQKVVQCPGVKEIRDRTDARIRGILTPDQQLLFTDLKAKREAEKAAEADKPAKD